MLPGKLGDVLTGMVLSLTCKGGNRLQAHSVYDVSRPGASAESGEGAVCKGISGLCHLQACWTGHPPGMEQHVAPSQSRVSVRMRVPPSGPRCLEAAGWVCTGR